MIMRRKSCPVAVLCLAMGSVGWSQLYSGIVTGVVLDPSNALIQASKVSMVDEDKAFTFHTVSDGAGRFSFRGIPP